MLAVHQTTVRTFAMTKTVSRNTAGLIPVQTREYGPGGSSAFALTAALEVILFPIVRNIIGLPGPALGHQCVALTQVVVVATAPRVFLKYLTNSKLDLEARYEGSGKNTAQKDKVLIYFVF